MNDTVPHDTSGGAASASTVRSLSGSTVGPSGSHDIIGPLQKASGPRKTEKTAMSHFPGLQDRVLSKCSDAHIYLDQETCSPFQRWQSASGPAMGIWPSSIFASTSMRPLLLADLMGLRNQASPRVSVLATSSVFGSDPATKHWLTVRLSFRRPSMSISQT